MRLSGDLPVPDDGRCLATDALILLNYLTVICANADVAAMIVGLGNDIVEIAVLKRELKRDGEGLKREIFTESEIAYCESKRYPERHLSARFAAKEALFKALGSGKIGDCSWKDIEIINDANGRPSINLVGHTRQIAERMSVRRIHISLTHAGAWAGATVILES